MAMAAGKSAGRPPRITDKAFKPPTDAAIAMTGNGVPAVTHGGDNAFSFGFIFTSRIKQRGDRYYLAPANERSKLSMVQTARVGYGVNTPLRVIRCTA